MTSPTYRFGRFELNPVTRQLLVDKQPAPLGARAFDVLLVLIEQRDRLVSKSELLDAVWPGLVVEENNLQVQISALRKLLGPQAIGTNPGRGYRFTAALDDAVDAGTDAASTVAAPSAPHVEPAAWRQCPKCHAAVAAGAQFCGHCGASRADPVESKAPAGAAAPAVPARKGERRQLTILFADLVGATALSAQLDPEMLRDILLSYQRVTSDCIDAYGGRVHQFLGDGALAYFGYPAAHDNDAERAVLAGLALVAAVGRLSAAREAQGEIGIQARVGIHTGLVILGAVGAGGSPVDLAVGETPNLAARIGGEAVPDSVYVSGDTRKLLGPQFSVRELEPRPLKGVARPIPIFAVDGGSDRAPDWEAGRHLAPLVARDSELQHLSQRWSLARGGRGQAVLISGEAGIGKSRLLAALRSQIGTSDELWRSLRCSSLHTNNALHPVIDLLERAIDAEPASESLGKPRTSGRLLSASGIDDAVSHALVDALLGLGDAATLDQVLAGLAPMQRRQRTLDTLIAWLQDNASKEPRVIVVEDLHWIDPSSRDLFGMLLERITASPVLLVMTFRPEFLPPWPLRSQVSTIALSRLTSDDALAIVRGLAGALALPARVVDEIVRRTDGVPLFVEELTRAVLSAGVADAVDGALPVADQAALSDVPASLRESLAARLDRLGSAKAVAQLASVLGRDFDYPLLCAVSDVPEAELEEQLASLSRADILEQSGMPPRAQYRFKHALLQEAAYDTLLHSARVGHHRRAAEAYVGRFPQVLQSEPELAAHHFGHAAMPAESVAYWRQAGELALARSGLEEAVSHLHFGLQQIKRMPASGARDAAELGLRVAVGPALLARLGFGAAEAGDNYARACDVAENEGATSDRFAAKWGDWLFKNAKGQLVAAARRSEELVELGRTLADDGYLLQAHHSRWTNLLFLGQAADARSDTQVGLRLFDPVRHRHHKYLYGGHDPYVCAHGFGAFAACAMGRADEARRLLVDAVDVARELDHTLTSTLPLLNGSMVLQELGEADAAGAVAEELLATCERHGILQWTGVGRTVLGTTLCAQGKVGAGIEMAEAGLVKHLALGPVGFAPVLHAMVARLHLRAGTPERALALLQEGLAMAERTQVGWQVPEVQRLEAETLLQLGRLDTEAAAAAFHAAADLARTQGADGLEARALASALRLGRSDKRALAARKRLKALCDAMDGHGSPDLEAARAALGHAP